MKSIIKELRNHVLIREKVSESKPHISSFNFTRKAFYDALWDDVNITARGLFINTENNTIAARSYNKFFNMGERPETQDRTLNENLVFPVSVYEKENGYLGIIGYDSKADELLFCSKSTIDGDFAIKFREIFNSIHDDRTLTHLKNVLKEQDVSMVFEVISPTFDPHIIKYDSDKLVLLDVIYNEIDFKKLDYDELLAWSEVNYPFHVKKKTTEHNSWMEFKHWLASVQNEEIEGYVVEDSVGFCFKIKLPFYSEWKYKRSIKDRILKLKRDGKDIMSNIRRNITDETKHFIEWAIEQDIRVLEKDIISIREMYLGKDNK